METAQMLIDAGVGEKAPYVHRAWLYLTETVKAGALRHRLEVSYQLIRSGL